GGATAPRRRAGGSARRGDIGCNGGIAATVEDFARVNGDDRAHCGPTPPAPWSGEQPSPHAPPRAAVRGFRDADPPWESAARRQGESAAVADARRLSEESRMCDGRTRERSAPAPRWRVRTVRS